jgi:hypothetical protein
MKTTRLLFAALTLAGSLFWIPRPGLALPSACSLRCSYPGTCYDECVDDENVWTTCYAWMGGSCDFN